MKYNKGEIEFLREWIRIFFAGRCVRCQRETRTVHEIEPRSARPGDWPSLDNMILLCQECHTWAHDTPSDVALPILLRCQHAAMMGRSLTDPVV